MLRWPKLNLSHRGSASKFLINSTEASRRDSGGGELEHWPVVVPVVQDWLGRWAVFLSDLPAGLALALLLLPNVLAIFSRNIALSLACMIMIFAAGLVFVAPANTAVILGTALYVGSVVALFAAIISRRKSRNFDEFAVLQMQVSALMAAEQRRLMRDMRSHSKGQAAEDPVG